MDILIKKEMVKDAVVMSDAYSAELIKLADKDSKVVAMDADLAMAVGMKNFETAHRDRFFDCGIAEGDMVGIAAGMSALGKVPYIHSFTPFMTRRAFDQIFISGGYARLNIKVVGSDPGITAAFNGGTHMCFEDMGLMRQIPQMTVIEPTDNIMMRSVLRQIKDEYGMHYMRLLRIQPDAIYEEGTQFEIGKGITLRNGSDVTIIASGIMVAEALKAAKSLQEKGISARVVDMFTWKPIDEELIIKCAKETGCVVTAENHNVVNGLNSAVAQVLSAKCPVPLEAIGCMDRFGEVGAQDYLQKIFKMTAEDIASKAIIAVSRKQ